MDNEVVIKVSADDDTKQGFDSVRAAGAKLGKDLDADAKKSSTGVGGTFGKGISGGLLSSLPGMVASFGSGIVRNAPNIARIAGGPIGAAIGAPAGMAAAAAMASIMGAALSAGAGSAGLGAGIALAIKSDPELASLGSVIGERLFGKLEDAAQKSLSGPIRDAMNTLGTYGDDIVDQWTDAFEKLGPSLGPLADAFGRGASELSGSLAKIAGESGPVLEALGGAFETLADSVGESLENLTENTEANAKALDVTSKFIGDGMVEVSGFIADMVTSIVEEIEIWKGAWDKITGAVSGGSEQMKGHTIELQEAMQAAADAADAERDSLTKLSEELKAQADPVFGLLEAQDKLREAQEQTAEATLKHGADSDEAESALRKQARAAIDLQGRVGALGATFDGQMTPAMRATLKAAGLTDRAIGGLEKQFKDAKRQGDQFAKRYTAQVGVRGYGTAAAQWQRLIAFAQAYENGMPAGFHGPVVSGGVGYAHGGIVGAAASGGMRSGLTWVGEHGPELLKLPPGAHVQSNPDSARMASGGGMGPLAITIEGKRGGSRDLLDLLVEQLQFTCRTQYGGSAQEMLGTSR